MTATLAHRGPDGTRHWQQGWLALGHCAFDTSAEELTSRQPLASACESLVLVLDGYLANFYDLRHDLTARSALLRNASDAELVLHAYRVWGEACLDHLDGEFAFIIFDKTQQRLFCACDHTGLRQLHYHWDGRTFVAATDIAGVLAALPFDPPPNLPYLAEHVANAWFTSNETPWQGLMRLPAAHCLTLDVNGPRLREYWHLPTDVTIRHKSDAEYAEHYRSVLTECVSASARTHAPLACDVSGGLDSSAIFCLADRLAHEGRLPAPDLLGFTLRAPTGTPADEADYVRAVERQTGRTVEAVDLFCPDLDWFAAQGAADRRLPFLPNTVMLRDIAAAAAARGCRVNLVGQGGDQWLDGHPHHIRQALRMGDWRALRQNLRADWSGMGAGWTMREMVRQTVTACLPDSLRGILLARRDQEKPFEGANPSLLSPAMRDALAARRQSQIERRASASPDARLKLAKLEFPFARLVYDMMNLQASQVGIEYRYPMLSRKFIEFSAATPEHIRWRGGTTKYIHRLALQGILPDKVLERESKAHFSQTFHLHLSRLEAACTDALEDDMYSKLIVPDELRREFTIAREDSIDRMPIWTLWGSFASAAFLEARNSGLHGGLSQ
ncbi:MAG: hypothetical protein JY451_07625 [Erythrobacter sp.]|nr:MAG: hypothetical protein JY451_07625 [Erythrobacter sp.]